MNKGARSRRRRTVASARRAGPAPSAPACSDSRSQPCLGGEPGRPQGSTSRATAQLQRAVWEREMRRLQVGARVLGAVPLALVARIIVAGLNPPSAVTATVIAVLLLATLGLRREGRRLEPERDDPQTRVFNPPSPAIAPRP